MTDRQKSRASTHADDCWSWGPRHYECAVGRIERDEALLRQALEALLGQRGEPDWHTGQRRENAITALRERLGRHGVEGMKERPIIFSATRAGGWVQASSSGATYRLYTAVGQ